MKSLTIAQGMLIALICYFNVTSSYANSITANSGTPLPAGFNGPYTQADARLLSQQHSVYHHFRAHPVHVMNAGYHAQIGAASLSGVATQRVAEVQQNRQAPPARLPQSQRPPSLHERVLMSLQLPPQSLFGYSHKAQSDKLNGVSMLPSNLQDSRFAGAPASAKAKTVAGYSLPAENLQQDLDYNNHPQHQMGRSEEEDPLDQVLNNRLALDDDMHLKLGSKITHYNPLFRGGFASLSLVMKY